MALNTFAGTGTSLSSNFYLRKFYTSNMDARTSSKRSSLKNSELSRADGLALRRAVKSLGSFEYDETKAENIRGSVRAYISTYNNAISSLSRSNDRTLERNMNQLKSLTKEYARDLDKIGITVKEDGTLSERENLFKAADLDKFEKLFSKDSDYMQRVAACGKRIERRSEDLCLVERNEALKAADKDSLPGSPDSGEGNGETAPGQTAVAQIVAQAVDLDMLLNTGVGKNINVSL